jgi:AcrR family transcriptional regulator
VTPTPEPKAGPYHHGDLRNALVQAGVELAREGGTQAIVLREAARRVGVSPNAAYRHFASLPDLIHAVAHESLAALAAAMQREISRRGLPTGDARQDAWECTRAVGRGYVTFALREPGLFGVAFDPLAGPGPAASALTGDQPGPHELLVQALEKLVAAGQLEAEDIDIAGTLAWSTVHGLSLLLLGPLSGYSKVERDQVIEATLTQIGLGLLIRS